MGLQSVYSYVCMHVYGRHLNSKKHMKVESNHNSESVQKKTTQRKTMTRLTQNGLPRSSAMDFDEQSRKTNTIPQQSLWLPLGRTALVKALQMP